MEFCLLRFFTFICLSWQIVISSGNTLEHNQQGNNVSGNFAFQLSESFVHLIAECAARSYESQEKLKRDESLRLFFKNLEKTEKSFCGFAKKINGSLVIAFNGTRAILDDIAAGLKIWGNDDGYKDSVAPSSKKFATHSGLSKCVMSCYDSVCSIIDENEFDQLIFTGHGAGAAIAQLFALKYCTNKRIVAPQTKVNVFAFGSPAVFNESAAKMYNDVIGDLSSIHISRKYDLVPYIFPFCHVGINASIYSLKKIDAIFASLISTACFTMSFFVKERKFYNMCGLLFAVLAFSDFHDKNFYFSTDNIKEVMERIQDNYSHDPFMDRNLLGRK